MEIPCYKTLEEKQKDFSNRLMVVNCEIEYEKAIGSLIEKSATRNDIVKKNKERLGKILGNVNAFDALESPFHIFRGINNASFNNFSSAQREVFLRNLSEADFFKLIQSEIKLLRESDEYNNYLKSIGNEFDDWHALSFLQHFGAHTPCLDFTTSLDTALFFATDNIKKPNDNPLSNYVSLYYMEYPCKYDIYEMYKNDTNNAARMLAEFTDHALIDTSKVRQTLGSMPFNDLYYSLHSANAPFMFIKNVKWIQSAPSLNIQDSCHSLENKRIKRQDGCFAVNFSYDKPFMHENLFCININKSLAGYIIDSLYKKGMNKETMYVDDQYTHLVNTIKNRVKTIFHQK